MRTASARSSGDVRRPTCEQRPDQTCRHSLELGLRERPQPQILRTPSQRIRDRGRGQNVRRPRQQKATGTLVLIDRLLDGSPSAICATSVLLPTCRAPSTTTTRVSASAACTFARKCRATSAGTPVEDEPEPGISAIVARRICKI